ncbi:hypothetical protein TWF281_011863 [Arthrobotrys megalospora]
MANKENTMNYTIITSPGSSITGSPPPTPIPSRSAKAAVPPSHRLPPMAVSGSPASALKAPLLTTNPANFIRDSYKSSIEIWSSTNGAWVYPEALQGPFLKFCVKAGQAILFVAAIAKGTPSKVPAYALVWPARSIASWACDTRRTRSAEGYLEVSFAMRFLDTPQLIAFGGGNVRPVILQPGQLATKFEYLRRIVCHVQTELEEGSAAWLRFTSCRPVHPACRTLAEGDTIPGMVSLSTDTVAAVLTPAPPLALPPTSVPVLVPAVLPALGNKDRVVQQAGGDGANNIPIVPGTLMSQRKQESAILVDLLTPWSEPAPPSLAASLAPTTFADLADVTLGPSSTTPLPPLTSPSPSSLPPSRYVRLPFTAGFAQEPTTLSSLNERLQSSAAEGKQAYLVALKEKRGYLEKLWLQCDQEIENLTKS